MVARFSGRFHCYRAIAPNSAWSMPGTDFSASKIGGFRLEAVFHGVFKQPGSRLIDKGEGMVGWGDLLGQSGIRLIRGS